MHLFALVSWHKDRHVRLHHLILDEASKGGGILRQALKWGLGEGRSCSEDGEVSVRFHESMISGVPRPDLSQPPEGHPVLVVRTVNVDGHHLPCLYLDSLVWPRHLSIDILWCWELCLACSNFPPFRRVYHSIQKMPLLNIDTIEFTTRVGSSCCVYSRDPKA